MRLCFNITRAFFLICLGEIFSTTIALSGFYLNPDGTCSQKEADTEFIQNDHIQWMYRISQEIPKLDLCETVEIQSYRKLEDSLFSTIGQGAVFKSALEKNKLFILTAAHVVTNSDKIEIRCGSQLLRAKIRGISPTKDLAVLEIEDAAIGLNPLFLWNGKSLPVPELLSELPLNDDAKLKKGSHYIQTSSELINPETLHLARVTSHGLNAIPNRYPVEIEIAPTPTDHPLVGSTNALLLKKQGIRPGMSGSPIIYEVLTTQNAFNQNVFEEKHYLSGILVKTFINNTESVAVPVETINEALPSLMKGIDPAKTQVSPFYIEKKLTLDKQNIIENSEIVFRSKTNEDHYQAVCPSPFVNSSSGLKLAGHPADVGKGGVGDSGGKGGSGDSGGGAAKDDYYNSNYYTLFRARQGCKETGIKDSKGNIFIALRKEDGGIIKVDSFEDISDQIQNQGSNFPQFIEAKGIKATNKDEAIRLFCADQSLFDKSGKPERVRIERRNYDPDNPDIAHYWHAYEVPNSYSFLGTSSGVQCDKKNNTIKVKLIESDFSADLTIQADTWSGTIKVRGCETNFTDIPKQLWSANIKNEKMDLQMSFSPDEDFLNFDIFSIAEKCNSGKQYAHDYLVKVDSPGDKTPSGNIWLAKVNMKLTHAPQFQETDVKAKQALEKETEELIALDNDLVRPAWKAFKENPKTSKQILQKTIQMLHERSMAELQKSRYGHPVSRKRLRSIDDQLFELKLALAGRMDSTNIPQDWYLDRRKTK